MLVDKDLNCVNGCGVLTANHYEGVPVHLCHQCKGIWLSFASLKGIINTEDRARARCGFAGIWQSGCARGRIAAAFKLS